MNKLNGEPFTKDEVLKIAFMTYALLLLIACLFTLLTGRQTIANICVAMISVPSLIFWIGIKLRIFWTGMKLKKRKAKALTHG